MKKLSRKVSLGLIIALLVAIVGGNLYFSRRYILLLPGITRDLQKIITVESGRKDARGKFFLVAVTSAPANVLTLGYAMLTGTGELQNREEVIPEGWTQEEWQNYLKRWMQESQTIAKIVALREVGLNTELKSDGVEVVKVTAGSPAEGYINQGDLILAVDSQPVRFADEVVRIVQNRKVGDPVDFTIKRGEEKQTVTVNTVANKKEKNKPMVGVIVQTHNLPALPLTVDIQTGEIGGPSAGLMFTLAIIDQLDPTDLTRGYTIAGTGTISPDGTVGPIGGVREKVVTAERDGAQYFFSPMENAADARKAAKKIKVVPISTLGDALRFLRQLPENPAAATK